eukprot:symbB.v1.2.007593.t1/scaffold386.1/size215569/19
MQIPRPNPYVCVPDKTAWKWEAVTQGPPRDQRPQTVDQLLSEPEIPIQYPPQQVQDQVAAVFNSLSQDNLQEKVEQLQRIVTPTDYHWLCYYTVSRRTAKEANFHQHYIMFFNACRDKKTLFSKVQPSKSFAGRRHWNFGSKWLKKLRIWKSWQRQRRRMCR